MVENQFESTIKIFQCNGRGESTKTEFLKHLSHCNIRQQISCLGTLKQNGITEKKHHHIVKTGLIILINVICQCVSRLRIFL